MIELIVEAMGKLNSDIIEADDICHDSVQFVIDGLDQMTLIVYALKLSEIVRRDTGCSMSESEFDMLKATAEQKTEAILKAKGLWVDAMEDGR